jgi:F420H(2)-dependent quinone reductase
VTATLPDVLLRYVGNPIVGAILRSPLHGMLSRHLMLLTVVGRRTGRRYTMPVGYVSHYGTLDVLVANRQQKVWWRNLEGGAPVELVMRGRTFPARAEALTFEGNPRAFTFALRNYVAGNPAGARVVRIRDVEDLAGLRSAAGGVAMVRIELPTTSSTPEDSTASGRARN